ncbi:MAG: hypothetical protein K8T90_05345 [Planctomycetes bacterium]|nr:hypothetical protein [Planctomycetota bacterium]
MTLPHHFAALAADEAAGACGTDAGERVGDCVATAPHVSSVARNTAGQINAPSDPPQRPPNLSGIPPVLTVEGFAELFGMPSGKAALKAIKRSGVPYAKFGKRVVILTDSLLGFLKSRERSSVQDEAELQQRQDAGGASLTAAALRLRRPRTASIKDAARALSFHAAAK